MADDIMANEELGVTKASLIAATVQRELAAKAMLTTYFTDVSVYAEPGAKDISFPKLTSFTVTNRAEGSKGERTALTAGLDKMDLDFNAYVSWTIDKKTALQSRIKAQMVTAQRAAAAQARYVDQQIVAEIVAVASSAENVGANADVTYDDLLNMMERAENAHAILEDLIWLTGTDQKKALFKIDELKDASAFGQAILPKGKIGEVLGAPVVLSTFVPAGGFFLVEKSAIAFGFQSEAEYGEQDDIDYGVGAKKCAIDQVFGVQGMQINQGPTPVVGKSALCFALND